jgi:DDE superfamily endonuclease
MLDEVIVIEAPPLNGCYGRRGQQVCVPITGHHSRRILHGVINVITGAILLLITTEWDAQTHQCFLQMIRAHWRGWHIILFEDRGSPHTAGDSLELAKALGIQIRLLPRATPELNAMDHLFRFVKGRALADRQTISIDQSTDAASWYLLEMTSQERLRKAGILSGNFWLTV